MIIPRCYNLKRVEHMQHFSLIKDPYKIQNVPVISNTMLLYNNNKIGEFYKYL